MAGWTKLSSLHTFVDQLRQYFTQMRQEIAVRLAEKVYVDDKPSKVCACVCNAFVTLHVCKADNCFLPMCSLKK